MIALDTNLLARYLLNDDKPQARAAARLLSGKEGCTAPPTVLLELACVLKANGCSREDIARGLRLLFGLPNFRPLQFEAVCRALHWFDRGMDFGDALHLALSAPASRFATFDKAFARQAQGQGASAEVILIGEGS